MLCFSFFDFVVSGNGFDSIERVLVEALLNQLHKFASLTASESSEICPESKHMLHPIYAIVVQFVERHLFDYVVNFSFRIPFLILQ